MMLIKHGTVAVRKLKGSAFIELAKIYPNEVIGELSFFDKSNRNASAIALSEVEVVEIEFRSLEKEYSKVPAYIQTILTCVAGRLRTADDTIRRLQHKLVRREEGVVDLATPQVNESRQDELREALEATDSKSPVTPTPNDSESSDE